ncbi:hypothetical protein F4809DRAFT_627187 [Biscogniauxia mediterranea]|nr:hypothetical protein F4809DRAFT_627187 [Biscogniauxia mediterranea]
MLAFMTHFIGLVLGSPFQPHPRLYFSSAHFAFPSAALQGPKLCWSSCMWFETKSLTYRVNLAIQRGRSSGGRRQERSEPDLTTLVRIFFISPFVLV